ncbi:MAG: efflux transporter periplasmic adaptor subunit, partial [Tabrizicola sp.]|nr:efflux transporter periplasmic adaptor subunit [Tabrizicola sp.]
AELQVQALARQKDLAARGVGSSQAVETAELQVSAAGQAVLSRRQALASAEARIDQGDVAVTRARIALTEAERALAETEITAEFSGRLDGVTGMRGALVGANEVLGRIVDPDALDVTMRLSTAQFAVLARDDGTLPDLPVRAVLAAGGAEIEAPGQLTRVGALVGEGQTGRLVYVVLDTAPGLRPGDFVTVHVEEPPLADAAMVPATSVGANQSVLVLAAEDRLEERQVEVLRRQGDAVIIAVGDLAGREIVAERSALLGAGIRIRPVRPDAADATTPPSTETAMITLTPERRAELIALVEANDRMPADAKARVLEQLQADTVPARVITRLEERMGG